MRSPFKPSLLQAGQFQLYQPFLTVDMLQSLTCLSVLLLDSFQYLHVSLVLENPELDPTHQMCPTSVEQRGRIGGEGSLPAQDAV